MIDYRITKADASRLAALHVEAFPNFFLSRLGERFLVQFYLGYVDDPSAVVAVCRDAAGHPVGVVVGTTSPRGFFGRLLRRRLFGFVSASALAAIRDLRTVPRLLKAVTYRGDTPPDREGALLSSICVDPSVSGRGLGSELIRGWTRKARKMGAQLAFLTTDADDNEAVNAWYRREGWTLSDQFIAQGHRLMNRYEIDLRSLEGES